MTTRRLNAVGACATTLALACLLLANPARATVTAHIDLSDQTMSVYVDGAYLDTWAVSTARRGYRTPVGTFRPLWLARRHFSSKYDNAPMPYSVFFFGGYAIHGTTETRSLGRPVSHGCVRLHPTNARRLFELIQDHGAQDTVIRITR